MDNNYTYVSILTKNTKFREYILNTISKKLSRPNEYSTLYLEINDNHFMRFDFLRLASGWTNIYINCSYYTSVKHSLPKFINEVCSIADDNNYLLIVDLHSRGYIKHNPIKVLFEHPTSDKDKWLLYAVR